MIEQAIMQELIYNPQTGEIFRLGFGKIGHRTKGYILNTGGYIVFKFYGKAYKAHRVAWFLQTGKWPIEIDHINGIRSDNRWENLREVTHSENGLNRRVHMNSKSGEYGIRLEANGKWRVRVRGKAIGTFWTKERAIAARDAALADG